MSVLRTPLPLTHVTLCGSSTPIENIQFVTHCESMPAQWCLPHPLIRPCAPLLRAADAEEAPAPSGGSGSQQAWRPGRSRHGESRTAHAAMPLMPPYRSCRHAGHAAMSLMPPCRSCRHVGHAAMPFMPSCRHAVHAASRSYRHAVHAASRSCRHAPHAASRSCRHAGHAAMPLMPRAVHAAMPSRSCQPRTPATPATRAREYRIRTESAPAPVYAGSGDTNPH